MLLDAILVPDWPLLAWVASVASGASRLHVLHGPMVEVRDEWVVEAVWAGDFAAGDFDRTDLVFGSGVRCRGDRVVFVSSGTVFDRLWHLTRGGRTYVSNSLPAMLAVTGLSLRDDYADYSRDVRTICKGLAARVASIPLESGQVASVYFNNLLHDGTGLFEVVKPDPAPAFLTYEDYHGYLVQTAKSLGRNLADPARAHRVVPLSGISSGYDSSAATVISRHAGCKRTVTISGSASLWRGSDSGALLAKCLGMSCTEHPLSASSYPMEAALWAAEGRAGIINWTLFDFPEPLCLFFTGWHGEKMWDRVCHDHPDPFVRRDPGSLGFCEWRLLKGVFQCPVPFWAARHNHQTRAITLSPAMAPWHMHRDYDKPIARRILEEAGVPRNLFGTVKRNTSHEAFLRWPYSPEARASFARYVRDNGCYAPPEPMVSFLRVLTHWDSLVHKNITRRVGLRRSLRHLLAPKGSMLVFRWANDELTRTYRQGLDQVAESMPHRQTGEARPFVQSATRNMTDASEAGGSREGGTGTWREKPDFSLRALTEGRPDTRPAGRLPTAGRKRKVVICLAAGGFAIQTVNLLRRQPKWAEVVLVGPEEARAKLDRDLSDHQGWRFVLLRPHRRQRRSRTWIGSIPDLVLGFVGAVRLLWAEQPDAVIGIGQRMAVYLLLAARLFGIRTAFVTCITRVTEPALTDRIISGLGLADRFYVQWPQAVRLHRRALYQGTLL
jgi:hypothetical protein